MNENKMKELVIKRYGLRKKNGCFDINKAIKVEKKLKELLESKPLAMEDLDLYYIRKLLK